MKHYLYKITNIETNQYYIGVRSSRDPKTDSYMGSSSIWTKSWVKENKDKLIKEIIDDTFESREDANNKEVEILKLHINDEYCVNKLFDKVPSHLGRKQSLEWIRKRIKSGKESGMYGKHHTEETKQRISEKLKGRVVTQEAREKIGNYHRGKIVSEETRLKQSEVKKAKIASGEIAKTYKPVIVEDLLLKTIEYFDGCKLFSDKYDLNYGSVKASARKGNIYKKRYKITYAAFVGDNNRKLGENEESPNEDNHVGSLGSTNIVPETAND